LNQELDRMTKTLASRPARLFLTAFATLGVGTLALDEMRGTSLSRPGVGSEASTRAQQLPVRGDLPNVTIETADGRRMPFAATDGQVRIVSMIYGHCPGVCPLTIDTLRGIDRQLTQQQRSKLTFVLLSLDPGRDTPEALRSLARERGITSARWLLGRTSAVDARAFAGAAHIQYRPLSDGSIDHSTALVLLDAQGRVLARTSGAEDAASFMTILQGVL
jgi:protein SCO1/2